MLKLQISSHQLQEVKIPEHESKLLKFFPGSCEINHISIYKTIKTIKLHLSVPPAKLILTTTERGPHGPANPSTN